MLSVVRDALCTGAEPYRIPLDLPRRLRPLYTPISMLSVVRDVLCTGVGPYRIPPALPRRVRPLCMPISMPSVVRDALCTGEEPYRIPPPLPRRVRPLYMSTKAGHRACGLQWSLRGVNVGRGGLLFTPAGLCRGLLCAVAVSKAKGALRFFVFRAAKPV